MDATAVIAAPHHSEDAVALEIWAIAVNLTCSRIAAASYRLFVHCAKHLLSKMIRIMETK